MNIKNIITFIVDNLSALSLFLITLVGIIENSKKISAKPVSKLLRAIGKKLNGEISEKLDEINKRQLSQEAYSLNDFYQRHINGEKLTMEQYELAIDMFEHHLAIGANSVNKLHLEVLKEYYMGEYRQ